MKVSIRQLAEYCKVSIGTVDRVVNHRPGVKKETKEKVEKAIRELGYQPNYLAKSLSEGRSMSIGVVLLNLDNAFFAQLSDAVVRQADAMGYFTCLTLSEKNPDKEFECLKNLMARQVDGVILFSTNQRPEVLEYIAASSRPVVTVMSELKDVPAVLIDDQLAMEQAVAQVLARGYRRLVYVSAALSYEAGVNALVQQRRYEGFEQAVQKAGAAGMLLNKPDFLAEVDRLNLQEGKTAFLCSSDVYALEIMTHLKQKGCSPPKDYGLMGFDNLSVLQHIQPLLSTVGVPIQQVGQECVKLLVELIQGGEPKKIVLPHSMVPGQTLLPGE